MTIAFSCPSCSHSMSIPEHSAGTQLYCTGCGEPFTVRSQGNVQFVVDQEVALALPAARLHIFDAETGAALTA